ncbi:MAG: hypothetical protein ACR2GE_03085 [Pseudonocardia sp.]
MRAGRALEQPSASDGSVLAAMPARRRTLLWASLVLGAIALFPQVLVPIGMKLSGEVEPVWFLALHLPEPLQWPTIAFMTVLGLAALGVAGWIYLSAVTGAKTHAEREPKVPAEPHPSRR